MQQPIKIYKREALYINKRHFKKEQLDKLKEDYTFRFYEEKACKECEYLEDRHCDICDNCAAYKGGTQLLKQVSINGNKMVSFPAGKPKQLISRLKKYRVGQKFKGVSKLPNPEKVKAKRKIKFLGELYDYQPEAVQACIDRKRGILKAPPRSGKCIVEGSYVMSEQGLTPIEDLFKNYSLSKEHATEIPETLSIATVKGEARTNYLYTKVVDRTYNVLTDNGIELGGTPEHPVLVLAPNLTYKWVKMQDLKEGDVLVASRRKQWLGQGSALYKITTPLQKVGDSTEPLQVPKEMTVELARLLGYWVANGSLNTPGRMGISTNNEEIQKDFIKCVQSVFPNLKPKLRIPENGCAEVVLHSLQLARFLEQAVGMKFGKARHKAVPSLLLKLDPKYIKAFLGAYTSCDAYISRKGIEYCSASKELIKQLQILLSYFGIVSYRTTRKGYARNSRNPKLRTYYELRLHSAETKQLLKQIVLLKPVPKQHDKYNTKDKVPYVYSYLKRIQGRYSVGAKRQLRNGELVGKVKLGGIFKRNKRGLASTEYDYKRHEQSNINYDVIKRLSAKHTRKLRKVFNTNIYYTRVVSITESNKPKRVYDLSVPELRHFVANGLVVHNTVMGTYLITELNGRALIVASQRDWLVGFYETFCGSATQKPLTDARGSGVTTKEINASRRSGERFDIGFCNTLEDFKRHDICLATVQTFQSPAGRKLLQKIRSRFKICMIDEVHYGAAPQFAKFISTMNVEYLIGLTGTDSRKDMRFVLMRELIGENVYEVKKEMLQPHVRLTRTKYKYLSKARQFNWVNFVTNLENDKARLKLIAETALRDVKDKHMVLIPLARVKAAKTLVDMINNLAGETIAVQFTGSIKKELRDKYIQDARNYKIKVMVGQAKILSTGINIPRASAIYEVTPSSNLENATQRIARILTPYEGKPTPILRFFLDDNNVRRNCYKNEWWKLIRPKFKPIIREKDAIIWNEYLKDTKAKANYLEF